MTARQALIAIRASYWFLPALLVLGSAVLALVMIEVDARLPPHVLESMPRLFGAGAEGSRAVLSAIATSTMTVAGVVFSINIVALSLATAQYSPHVLQNFMRDRANQAVLGIFLGIFTYCLIVLRTIRGGDENFVPGASIVTGILLALVGVAFLIFFIHHVSVSIQVSHIVSRIAADTRAVIERIYPERGKGVRPAAPPRPEGDGMAVVLEDAPGYIEHIDYDALAELAHECKTLVRVPLAVGDFARTGEPLVVIHGMERPSEAVEGRIRRAFALGTARNIDQDVAFGLQQLVDIAVRALSSSNNDATTAIHALEHLTVLLSMLAGRDVDAHRFLQREGRTVVACDRLAFEDFVAIVVGAFRHHARRSPAVLDRLVETLERIGTFASGAGQVAMVLERLAELEETVRAAGFERVDEEAFHAAIARARRRLVSRPVEHAPARSRSGQ